MSLPIITGVVLAGLGAFLGGIVTTGLGVLIVFRSISYHSQSRVS